LCPIEPSLLHLPLPSEIAVAGFSLNSFVIIAICDLGLS
jgi:hypothetical protein